MSMKLALVLGGFIVGAAGLISSLETWELATKPLFVGGLLLQLGTAVTALYTDSPSR